MRKNANKIAELIRGEYVKHRMDNYEVVVALTAFTCKGLIDEPEFKEILYYVLDYDDFLIIKSLHVVSRYIDKEMIDAIIGL